MTLPVHRTDKVVARCFHWTGPLVAAAPLSVGDAGREGYAGYTIELLGYDTETPCTVEEEAKGVSSGRVMGPMRPMDWTVLKRPVRKR